jgi:hypothetical protein
MGVNGAHLAAKLTAAARLDSGRPQLALGPPD